MTVHGFAIGIFITVIKKIAEAARNAVEFLIAQVFVGEFIFLRARVDIFFLCHVYHLQKFFCLL